MIPGRVPQEYGRPTAWRQRTTEAIGVDYRAFAPRGSANRTPGGRGPR
jgi:hypothetical protein